MAAAEKRGVSNAVRVVTELQKFEFPGAFAGLFTPSPIRSANWRSSNSKGVGHLARASFSKLAGKTGLPSSGILSSRQNCERRCSRGIKSPAPDSSVSRNIPVAFLRPAFHAFHNDVHGMIPIAPAAAARWLRMARPAKTAHVIKAHHRSNLRHFHAPLRQRADRAPAPLNRRTPSTP